MVPTAHLRKPNPVEPLDNWFAREILVHEPAFTRFLKRYRPDGEVAEDLRLEAYVSVYEAAAERRPAVPKSFLFATARHLMAHHARRMRVVLIEATGEFEPLNTTVDAVSPEGVANAGEDLNRLVQAFDRLPPKCREVIWMRKVEGLSQKEIAARLETGEGAVEKHIVKAIRLLPQLFYGGDELSARETG